MAATYLTRTNSGAGSETTSTFSVWFKRLSTTGTQYLLHTSEDANNKLTISFNGSFNVIGTNNSSTVMNLTPTRVFRDIASWYHLVVVFDTTQATEADRVKLYINGVQETSFSTATYPSQNLNLKLNQSGDRRTVGTAYDKGGSPSAAYWDGSMTHVNFIDGTAYPASTFGEVDSTSGIWKPNTSPSVTYGTNGFFLKMENASAMGTDSSGNSNTFTVSGSLTKNQDTPNNNFATMNPLDNYYSAATFSNGNNTVATAAAPVNWVASTFQVNKGKWYAECKPTAGTGSALVGFAGSTSKNSTQILETAGFFGGNYVNNGEYFFNGSGGAYASSFANGDIISVYLDLDNNFVYFAKNGVLQNSGVPTSGATGTGGKAITAAALTTNGGYAFACGDGNTATRTFDWNFGNGYFGTTAVSSAGTNASGIGIFEYDVPTGYTALSTKGLNL